MKYLFPFIMFFVLSCNSNDEKTTNEDFSQMTNNQKWLNHFNSDKDSLAKLYFEKAIKINPAGEILNGKDAIINDWKKADWEIKNITELKKVSTHKNTHYEYEIGEFKNSKDETFRHLLIWNTKEKTKTRELEFIAKVGNFSSNKNKIDQRRKEWMLICNSNNAKKLVHELYAENAVYYNHKPVVIGRDAITKEYSYMNNPQYNLTLTPIHLEEVTNNLAYEIGQCSGGYGGKYMIVWQKDETGKWYVLMDSNI